MLIFRSYTLKYLAPIFCAPPDLKMGVAEVIIEVCCGVQNNLKWVMTAIKNVGAERERKQMRNQNVNNWDIQLKGIGVFTVAIFSNFSK